MILLDTSVLSHVFRRRAPEPVSDVVSRFSSLVAKGYPLAIPGVVLQEILSGVRDPRQFDRLRVALDGFPLIIAGEEDHLEAARLVNSLRRRGVTASSFDALIAAMTILRDGLLFTLDQDFFAYSRLTALRLLEKGSEE
ncbi:MAG TPA: PIN domain-containing protein [Thermoanaerobaculia bacterium]|nr:PIN domain-containing protein [Thermoanaerobaculia bacterium]